MIYAEHIDAIEAAATGVADALAALRVSRVVSQYQRAQERLWGTVEGARAEGVPWEVVGYALGVTRQSAHERFSKAVPDFRL
jgi:hypothetical protein